MKKKKIQRITELLLKNYKENENFWPGLPKGETLSKKEANKFMLGAILDYQIPAQKAWGNACRLAEDVFDDPDDLWEGITAISQSRWNDKFKKYSLHRFPKAHERVWRIGKEIVEKYDGDARVIWKKHSPYTVLHRLNELRVGKQISRMVVGALLDTEQIQANEDEEGRVDVKVDIHVRRVLGRLLRGKGYDCGESSAALQKTRAMYPKYPWRLDRPLYELGKSICISSNPKCRECYLRKDCEYHYEN